MARSNATLRPFFWRATRLYPEKEVVARTHDGTETYTYSEFGERARLDSRLLPGVPPPADADVRRNPRADCRS